MFFQNVHDAGNNCILRNFSTAPSCFWRVLKHSLEILLMILYQKHYLRTCEKCIKIFEVFFKLIQGPEHHCVVSCFRISKYIAFVDLLDTFQERYSITRVFSEALKKFEKYENLKNSSCYFYTMSVSFYSSYLVVLLNTMIFQYWER